MPSKKIVTKVPSRKDIMKSIKFSKKQVWVVASVVIVLSVLFFAKSVFIAAIVDGRPVSRLSVIKDLEKQGGKAALDSLITQTLIQNEATKKNITVSKTDADDQIKTIQVGIEKQGSTLDKELAARGMTNDDLLTQVKLQLMLDKLVGKEVAVSDKEVNDYIETNKDQLPQAEIDATLSGQIKQQISQQKLQQKVQDFLKNLKAKAKITNFVNY